MNLSKLKNFNKFSSKGFTLIELLIVIAIIGILAAALLVAINPATRINQAKDSAIKSDIAQISNAMQTYFTNKGTTGSSYYPSTVADLLPSELKSEPKINGTTSYSMRLSPLTCTTAAKDCAEVAVYAVINDTTTSEVWCWRSYTGIAAKVANAAACTAP